MTHKELKHRILQNFQFLLTSSIESNQNVPVEKKEEVLSHLEDFINLCHENYKFNSVIEIANAVTNLNNIFQDFIYIKYSKCTIH